MQGEPNIDDRFGAFVRGRLSAAETLELSRRLASDEAYRAAFDEFLSKRNFVGKMLESATHADHPECVAVRNRFADLSGTAATTDAAGLVEGHLDACARCRLALEVFVISRSSSSIEGRVREKPRSTSKRRTWGAAVGVVALLTFAGFAYREYSRPVDVLLSTFDQFGCDMYKREFERVYAEYRDDPARASLVAYIDEYLRLPGHTEKARLLGDLLGDRNVEMPDRLIWAMAAAEPLTILRQGTYRLTLKNGDVQDGAMMSAALRRERGSQFNVVQTLFTVMSEKFPGTDLDLVYDVLTERVPLDTSEFSRVNGLARHALMRFPTQKRIVEHVEKLANESKDPYARSECLYVLARRAYGLGDQPQVRRLLMKSAPLLSLPIVHLKPINFAKQSFGEFGDRLWTLEQAANEAVFDEPTRQALLEVAEFAGSKSGPPPPETKLGTTKDDR